MPLVFWVLRRPGQITLLFSSSILLQTGLFKWTYSFLTITHPLIALCTASSLILSCPHIVLHLKKSCSCLPIRRLLTQLGDVGQITKSYQVQFPSLCILIIQLKLLLSTEHCNSVCVFLWMCVCVLSYWENAFKGRSISIASHPSGFVHGGQYSAVTRQVCYGSKTLLPDFY